MRYRLLSQYRPELMGIAMLWVMYFHAYDMDIPNQFLYFLRSAGFGGVDMFILLSTMGLSMSLQRREQDYAGFMARRAWRILPAYYVVMFPYTLFLIATQDAPWSALVFNALLLYYWMSSAGRFNWYVAGAMTFYAITPPCLRALQRSRRRERFTAVAVVLTFALGRLLVREGYWYVMDIFFRLPLFFLGLLVGLYVAQDRKLEWKDYAFWLFWLALGACYLVGVVHTDQDVFPIPLCHLFLFTTVPMCLVIAWLFDHLPLGWLRRALRLVGENSLEIYLLNVSFFSQFAFIRQFVHLPDDHRLYHLVMTLATIALGWLLHRCVAWAKARLRPQL